MRHASANGRKSHPGIPLLVAETGLGRNKVMAAATSLVEKGWLILMYSGRGGDYRANEYDLCIPSQSPDAGTLGNSQDESQSPKTGAQSPKTGAQSPTGGTTDALRTALGTAPHHQENEDDQDFPSGEAQVPSDDDAGNPSLTQPPR
jgi:hypothetical protein